MPKFCDWAKGASFTKPPQQGAHRTGNAEYNGSPAGALGAKMGNILVTTTGFDGSLRDGLAVDVQTPALDLQPVKADTHHVLVIDRSGSMYCDLPDLKAMVEKLLTLQEYTDDSLRVSLISYSSSGDVKLHFARVTVADVLKSNSPYLQEIRSMQVTGMTCISQAVALAQTVIQPDEATVITLHTDGYANDTSPTDEARKLDKIVQTIVQNPNVSINTLAYRNYCDFTLLSRIAQLGSGTCIQVNSAKQTFDTLKATMDLLSGSVCPSLTLPIGKADYQVAVSKSAGKILGSDKDLVLKGLKPTDDLTIYQYTKQPGNAPVVCAAGSQEAQALLAYAATKLAQGRLNEAKFAVAGSCNQTLLEQHGRALTSNAIAAFYKDLTDRVLGPQSGTQDVYGNPGFTSTKTSVIEVMAAIDAHKHDIRINQAALNKSYIRRGVHRVAGSRDDFGNFTPATHSLKAKGTDFIPISSIDLNRSSANLNMTVVRKSDLVDQTGKVVDEVAGIPLDLADFRAYTVIGDGQVCVDRVSLKFQTQKAYKALQGLCPELTAAFDPTAEVVIVLQDRPVMPYAASFQVRSGVADEILLFKTLESILSASLKAKSEQYTPEQIDCLKQHCLSANLYFNAPTCNWYTDLQDALQKGQIDTRVAFKVDFGTVDVLSTSKLHSANKFLERMYELQVAGKPLDKPTFEALLAQDPAQLVIKHKVLSARVKITKVDLLMKDLFDDLFGLNATGKLDGLLGQEQADVLKGIFQKGIRQDLNETLSNAQKHATSMLEALFVTGISPIVCYIGSTGLIPESLQCDVLTAEEFTQRYPEAGIGKAEAEGTFAVMPDGQVWTIYQKNEYFDTPLASKQAQTAPALVQIP